MATTTPNYGWTVPTSTDLVKDGATAIETLGDAIDASMNTALGTKKAGMVLLNTTSFSGVSSQALPATTFNANFESYRLVLYFNSVTADASIYIKMRSGATDNSDAQYSWASQGRTRTDSGVNSTGNAQTTGWKIGESDSGVNGRFYAWSIDINNPFLAQNTLMTFLGNAVTTAAIPYSLAGGGFHEVATSYDSANIIMSSGNMSGKVSVYGYNL